MRLATLRIDGATRAVKLEGSAHVDLGAPDVGTFLAQPDWEARATAAQGRSYMVADADFAPVIPNPSKIICVGLNYRSHIEEMGRELPAFPVLFAKFADTLTGPYDVIVKPSETEQFDWECELAVVIGRSAYRVTGHQAEQAIGGYTVLNDLSARDWQFRTREWLQGKIWHETTPVGPYVVTPDELHGGVRPQLATRLTVDGEEMQSGNTSDLVFDGPHLVEYISTIVRLNPGDIIATGTNGGVGHARDPQRFLVGGETVAVEIEGLGRVENKIATPR